MQLWRKCLMRAGTGQKGRWPTRLSSVLTMAALAGTSTGASHLCHAHRCKSASLCSFPVSDCKSAHDLTFSWPPPFPLAGFIFIPILILFFFFTSLLVLPRSYAAPVNSSNTTKTQPAPAHAGSLHLTVIRCRRGRHGAQTDEIIPAPSPCPKR